MITVDQFQEEIKRDIFFIVEGKKEISNRSKRRIIHLIWPKILKYSHELHSSRHSFGGLPSHIVRARFKEDLKKFMESEISELKRIIENGKPGN